MYIIIKTVKSYAQKILILSLLLFINICLFIHSNFFSEDIVPLNTKSLEQLKQKNNDKNSFSFIVLGDNKHTDNKFLKILEDLENLDKKPDFIVNVGDISELGFKNMINHYIKLTKATDIPIITVRGNHERIFDKKAKDYKQLIGDTDFYFLYKNSLFIILDSSNISLTDKQLNFLKNTLKNNKYKNSFIFTHVPVFLPENVKEKQVVRKALPKDIQQKFLQITKKYNVTAVFTGHIHSFYKKQINNTLFFITGGAGNPGLFVKEDTSFHNHFIKVDVNKDSISYTTHFLKTFPYAKYPKLSQFIDTINTLKYTIDTNISLILLFLNFLYLKKYTKKIKVEQIVLKTVKEMV